jgi:hypothetical protein
MHGNDKRNQDDHHLYQIYDKDRKGVFKYGISGQPLNEDGSSPRANEQVSLFNKVVGWARFFASILIIGIKGRAKAQELEDQNNGDFKH